MKAIEKMVRWLEIKDGYGDLTDTDALSEARRLALEDDKEKNKPSDIMGELKAFIYEREGDDDPRDFSDIKEIIRKHGG